VSIKFSPVCIYKEDTPFRPIRQVFCYARGCPTPVLLSPPQSGVGDRPQRGIAQYADKGEEGCWAARLTLLILILIFEFTEFLTFIIV